MATFVRFLAALWVLLGCVLLPGMVSARENLADTIAVSALPSEARQTLAMIKQGGPYPYAKDGTIFGNFEKRLPIQPRGYYREYTVRTPGSRNRGPRRIVAGGDLTSSAIYYYTDDHYQSFRRIKE